MQFGLEENDKVFATKWQYMNNPVRSAGSDSTSYLNPVRVQYRAIEPLQGSSIDYCFSSGCTGGYSNSSPAGFLKRIFKLI
jgi:hypothetical protein